MSSPKRAIRFYFDFISHNAYLAWTQIHALAERHDARVLPVPVLFAGLLGAHGQLGPAEIRPKAWWMVRDVMHKAADLGVPLAPPASHPFRPLLALRVAGLPREPSAERAVIDRLFRAAWAESRSVEDPVVVAGLLDEIGIAGVAGIDGAAAVAEASEAAAKERLRRATDGAIAAGVFGVPTMVVDQELFWGYDDFGFLERYLAGADPLPAERLAEWRRVRPTAMRKEVSRR